MSHRANILGRLRRWNTRAARPVAALFAVAYLSAGAAPCAAAPTRASGAADVAAVHDHHAAAAHDATSAHEGHAADHQQGAAAPYSQHGHEGHGAVPAVAHDTAPPPAEHGSHCPHCPAALGGAAAIAHGNDHASCAALEDLTNVAAAHVKDAPPPLAMPLVPAPFTLPPPLASPVGAPPSRAPRMPSVPLNVRHCVFLI